MTRVSLAKPTRSSSTTGSATDPPSRWPPLKNDSLRCADAVVGHGCRNIQPRITIEEANRLQTKADGRDRHNWPVLGPHHVMRPERVPDHHIGIHDRAIVARVPRPAGAASMLVR